MSQDYNEIEVVIDTEEMSTFLYHELTKRGFVPTENEVDEIADIMFDFLIEKSVIDNEIE